MEYLDDFCAITEHRPGQFHKTRVSIWSFIKNNEWFDGKIIILVLNESDIKDEEITQLDQIYDKLEIVKLDSRTSKAVRKKISKRHLDQDHTLDFSFLHTFKIKSRGNLYFSSSIVFNRDITSFLNEGCASFALKSGKLPSGSGMDINPSMFYIPGDLVSPVLFNTALVFLENNSNIFSSDSKSQIISSTLADCKIPIHRLSLINLVDSSSFPESKYREFLRYNKAICAINMNTLELNDHRFVRMNLLWQQLNKQSLSYTPSKVKITKKLASASEIFKHKSYIESLKNVNKIDLFAEFGEDKVINIETSHRIAIFTTLNDGYIKYAITCFESFKRNSKEDNLDFYVFCKDATLESQKKLNERGIKLIHMDLSDRYRIPSDYPYPSECFWIFDCPDILYKLGYSHSIGVDADTYCNLPLNLSWISDVNGIAGIDRGSSVKKFLSSIGQLTSLNMIFKISEVGLSIKSINTGVLVFNNKYCYENKFSEKIHRIFSYSMDNGIPRKGDDSLFSIFLAIFKNTPIKYIDRRYNDYGFYNLNTIPNIEPIIIHYGKIKPWSKAKRKIGEVTKHYFNKWINFEKMINQ